MIEQSSIETLKSSIDIVDVIGGYIELKKAGANYKANCPFHGEKTPSFVVSPTKQIYHCFGCGAGGDAIKFVMEYERLSYPEAIEKLAANYNIALRYTKGGNDYGDAKRLLEQLQLWYRKNLDLNAHAQRYLKERGVSLASIERFGIGYVPQGSEVMRFLQRAALPLPKALEAGVLAQSEGGRYYARLSERITFPIYSPAGAIVGFGGRTLGSHPAKYINSPQTKLFNKSRLLYGYHLAKEKIYKSKRLIVCEGYLDTIMFHQAGFSEAVATLGTALTQEHLPLLRKGEPKVILAYDGDKAGVAAALKAAQLLARADFEGGVVLFPDGMDPADMVAKGKSAELAKLLRGAKGLISFVLETIASQYDLQNPRAKQEAFEAIKRFLDSLSPIVREGYVQEAAAVLRIAPAHFGTMQHRSDESKRAFVPKRDHARLSILKSLLENDALIESVIELVDASFFEEEAPLFEALLRGDREDARLTALSLDESIAVLSESELRETLRMLILKRYEEDLQRLGRTTGIDFAKKSYLIRKIKSDILPRLKRGESVAYMPIT